MAHILVAEDELDIRELINFTLMFGGHTVTTAANGEEAVQKATENKPDLILMDVVMPGMNGFQATRSLNKDPSTAAIPVIILSNKSMETDRIWGLRQGARDYLVKPAKEDDLIGRVNAILAG